MIIISRSFFNVIIADNKEKGGQAKRKRGTGKKKKKGDRQIILDMKNFHDIFSFNE